MKAFFKRRRSHLVAFSIAAAVSAWVWSGDRTGGSSPPPQQEASAKSRQRDPDVRVAVLESQPVSRSVVISGRTEPARAVTLRAEIDGRIVAIGAERGARVAEGEEVVRLDPRALAARRREARALVRQRELEFEAARKLSAQNFQTESALAAAEANLEAARAAVARVEFEIASTRLRAPFAGRLDQRMVEIGDYVNDGTAVARILQEDPILVVGDVTQHERHHVRSDDVGRARLVTGQTVQGRVRYVASESDEATRTFRIELEVPNPEGTLVSGISTEIHIPLAAAAAHRISPALLALDEQGRLGIKSVGDAGVVEFHPVEILHAETSGIWVSGLPDPVRVITVGHGFVRTGQRVSVVPAGPGEEG